MTNQILNFLSDLKKHNNREWFEQNRKQYEAAKKEFLQFYEEILLGIANFDDNVSKNIDECRKIFRINRDVRFSKDKSPYKTNMGGLIYSGAKDSSCAIYYVHVSPGECGIAVGIHMPESDQLFRIRKYISQKYEQFEDVIYDKTFADVWGEIQTELKLKKMPSDYPSDHPAGDLLKLKSFTFWKPIKDKDMVNPKFAAEILSNFELALPLIEFLNKAVK